MDMLGGKGTNTPTIAGSVFLVFGIICAIIVYFINGQQIMWVFWFYIGVAVVGLITLLIGIDMK